MRRGRKISIGISETDLCAKKKKQEICAKIFVQSTHVHLKHDFFGKLYYVPETNQKKAFFFLAFAVAEVTRPLFRIYFPL